MGFLVGRRPEAIRDHVEAHGNSPSLIFINDHRTCGLMLKFMRTNFKFRAGSAVAMGFFLVSTAALQFPALAQTVPTAHAQSGPHQAESSGVAVHVLQGLRHPGSKSSSKSGVTVKVTPKSLGSAGWEFTIALDSHRQRLNDDLQATTVLVVDGKEIKPTEWQGGKSTKRHREGVLAFPSPAVTATVMELRIQRTGESAPRVFRWEGAALK
jgi:hypothetical protein